MTPKQRWKKAYSKVREKLSQLDDKPYLFERKAVVINGQSIQFDWWDTLEIERLESLMQPGLCARMAFHHVVLKRPSIAEKNRKRSLRDLNQRSKREGFKLP